MGNILIKNVFLNGGETDIYIENGKIVKIGDCSGMTADEIIVAKGMGAVPGFVNMHTHAAMTLMRGVEEDLPLGAWLRRIWQVEANVNEETVYWGTKLACIEMIKSGTTTFNDHYWKPSAAVQAVKESGIRSWSSYVCMDHGDSGRAEADKRGMEQAFNDSASWGDKSSFVAGCHSTYEVSKDMLLWCRDFAKERGLKLHIHLCETAAEVEHCRSVHGMSPVRYLDSLGMLGPWLIAAHTLWLDVEDIKLLGENHVNVVHNINSNLKIASGYRFMYDELVAAGANVTLGTDGCASSNNLDMLEAMKTAAMVQKAWRGNPKAMPLNELLDIATVNGAKALGLDAGRIECGMEADLSLVNMRSSVFIPNINFLSNLVYSAHSDAIDTVICGGRIVMRGRRIEGEDRILEAAAEAGRRLLEKSGIKINNVI
ncbi:MAG: amidohydrolase [Bacteroidetes bacterium]|uniref:Amidohydrolase n=1 Tax=Candidatus Merdivivens pullistercoris TaxID=2840873 RepID=A0A9D9NA90_9BACT|nr:amidohydrolase [Candidatus Merdivivens pullistercoris]